LKSRYNFLFSGNLHYFNRQQIKKIVQTHFSSAVFEEVQKDFIHLYKLVSFVISPMGTVRKCFRTLEL
jgi:hypothetical protein